MMIVNRCLTTSLEPLTLLRVGECSEDWEYEWVVINGGRIINLRVLIG